MDNWSTKDLLVDATKETDQRKKINSNAVKKEDQEDEVIAELDAQEQRLKELREEFERTMDCISSFFIADPHSASQPSDERAATMDNWNTKDILVDATKEQRKKINSNAVKKEDEEAEVTTGWEEQNKVLRDKLERSLGADSKEEILIAFPQLAGIIMESVQFESEAERLNKELQQLYVDRVTDQRDEGERRDLQNKISKLEARRDDCMNSSEISEGEADKMIKTIEELLKHQSNEIVRRLEECRGEGERNALLRALSGKSYHERERVLRGDQVEEPTTSDQPSASALKRAERVQQLSQLVLLQEACDGDHEKIMMAMKSALAVVAKDKEIKNEENC